MELLDWRRRVAAVYAVVRHRWNADPREAHTEWRNARDDLFRAHPQSPLPAASREVFDRLDHFPYDPSFSFTAEVEPVSIERFELGTSTGGVMVFERFGTVRLPIGSLDVYWLDDYGGGLFVPFRDSTNGQGTYGGGRYLLDTAKGADLGLTHDGALVLDFNFAYNPSCSYDPAWTCPLPPPGNRLTLSVEAGERA